MAQVKNYHYYGDAASVQRLKGEYDFIGRSCKIVEPGHLVVFALPFKKTKEKRERSDARGGSEARETDRTESGAEKDRRRKPPRRGWRESSND